MDNALDSNSGLTSSVPDIRYMPLGSLPGKTTQSLRRIVPAADSRAVPVAAFNASL